MSAVMETIDIRIDLGAVSLVASGQTVAGNASVTMAVDRCALVALIQGARELVHLPEMTASHIAPEIIEVVEVAQEAVDELSPVTAEIVQSLPADPLDAVIDLILADDSPVAPEEEHLVEAFDKAIEVAQATVAARKGKRRKLEHIRGPETGTAAGAHDLAPGTRPELPPLHRAGYRP